MAGNDLVASVASGILVGALYGYVFLKMQFNTHRTAGGAWSLLRYAALIGVTVCLRLVFPVRMVLFLPAMIGAFWAEVSRQLKRPRDV